MNNSDNTSTLFKNNLGIAYYDFDHIDLVKVPSTNPEKMPPIFYNTEHSLGHPDSLIPSC